MSLEDILKRLISSVCFLIQKKQKIEICEGRLIYWTLSDPFALKAASARFQGCYERVQCDCVSLHIPTSGVVKVKVTQLAHELTCKSFQAHSSAVL